MRLWQWLFGKKHLGDKARLGERPAAVPPAAPLAPPLDGGAPLCVGDQAPGVPSLSAGCVLPAATSGPQPGAVAERQIRVFISSTFRDMHAERNYLVTWIFPQLRQLCEARGVTWGEVDLRWGVTDEAAAEGQVLPICFEEINRCRPYFIGLLGERYGWVPQSIADELLDKEAWLREEFHGRKSVTELEILHGVLRNPAMAGHAYFYFRDPAYITQISPEHGRQDFLSETSEDEGKLRQLKERIRKSKLPLRENYPDPETLGEFVLDDLTAVVNKHFPEGSQPDPLTREALGHAAYARSRERVHIGRPEYFARLDAHAAADDDQPLVILGESGSGKSALLANWAARYRHAHPEALVLEHYIGASPPASADWAAMLRRILGEFKRQLGLTQDIPKQPDALRGAFANWLHMAAAKGRIVLILDSLNQLEDRDGAAELLWLPRLMPEKLRLIVSTLPGKSLTAITERHWPTLTVEPFLLGERQQLICLFLRDYGRRLSPARVERIAGAPQSANPLYLRVLLNELRLFGQHEHLEERIAYYLQAASPSELYGMVIARWEENYGAGTSLVCDTLSLLWAARYGLSESELLDALGQNGERLPHAVWSPLSLAMADALVSRSALLSFTHDFLRTAARETYLPRESDQQEAHLHLADYFERQPAGARRTDELPWQLAEAGAWRRLYDLLVDRSFFTVAWERNEFDVKTYWTKIEAGSALRVVDAFREQVEHPESEGNKGYLWFCSRLLADTGHPHEALRLSAALVEHSRASGDLSRLQESLGAQASILFARGSLDEAMALVQEQDQLCQRLGDLTGVQLARGGRAIILFAQGDLDGALALHAAAEHFWRGVGNLHGLQASLNNRAVILYKRGDLSEALTLYKEQEQICLQLGDLKGQVTSLGNQAPILQDRGDLEGSLTLLAKAEEICRRLGDLPQLQVILNNRAVVLYKRGEFGESMATLEEQDRLSRQLGDLKALSSSLGQQALILHAHGDLDGALALHKEQGRISKQLDDLDGLQTSFGNQALILQDRGDLDGAMALHREEERICRQLGNLKGLQESRGHQAAILHARGDLAGAMALLKEKERICQQLGNLQGLSSSLGNQGLIWKNRGNLGKALALHKKQEQLCRQIGHLDGLSHSLGSQGLILMERGDLDAAMALHREDEQICRQLGSLKGLSRSLGNQAKVLCRHGDLDAAMGLGKQEEGLLRQLGDMHGLVLCLINQSLILEGMGSVGQALPLAEDAYQLANRYGYGRLVREIEPIAQRMRQACDGYG